MSNIIKTKQDAGVVSKMRVISVRRLPALPEETGDATAVKEDIFAKYQTEAERLLLDSQKEAEAVRRQIAEEKKQWEQEKAKLTEQAQRQGFEAGYADGRKEGFESIRDHLNESIDIVNRSKEAFKKHLEASEKDILEIAMKAAGKILQDTLETSPEKMFAIVKNVLKEAAGYKEVDLHIYPGQYAFVMDNKEELDALFPNDTKCYVYPDDSLEPYQVFIESGSGRIDASIDSQLSELKAKLLELIGEDAE
ncbi:flagellar assembly protein FliH [Heyndrickxia faecalis]|uniref:flagellar assembly protein FliH n=1 Tax=Heyndrickxia faecalis TaxID=2824910 RepID=UPI003D231AD4